MQLKSGGRQTSLAQFSKMIPGAALAAAIEEGRNRQRKSGGRLTSLAQFSKMVPGAALAAAIEEATGAITRVIPIGEIVVKPQDRVDFNDIKAFAERLRLVGHVHTAILVRAIDGGGYELIAGERRVRGSAQNEWEDILATIFPSDTLDFVIRQYQVSENVDRKPLSAKETATGLAGDVERFGREQAAKLWTTPSGKQRSESWISKHLRFRKYGPITRELFDAGLFDDIEAANKMDDIETASVDTAHELADTMKAGEKIGRVTLDARLSLIKGGAHIAVLHLAASTSPVEAVIRASDAGPDREEESDAPRASGERASTEATPPLLFPPLPHAGQQTSSEPRAARQPSSAPRPKQERGGRADPQKTVVWRVEELYEVGTDSIHRFRQLQADLTAAGMSQDDADWRLWVAFVQLACSALVGVGSDRADKMINRLVDELNSKGPIELLNALHPSRRTGVLPDDFRYDTQREIHPLAPNNWAL
ncbi:ParB/RepB/Spo0J family partition protein [Burkholderia multivorans]|uniref:ParB/RepB/Spo0J family partition protein n=1 Tax=Burkholderia multivorans TaxID=87883 RepID=UPI0021C160A7|nr:ParB N-terminal domain-containing protein [Burkholderia multivorans]